MPLNTGRLTPQEEAADKTDEEKSDRIAVPALAPEQPAAKPSPFEKKKQP